MSTGRLIHARGADTLNIRSPDFSLVRGMNSCSLLADRRTVRWELSPNLESHETNDGDVVCYLCLAGKSSLLSAIGNREFPIPDHIDIYHLQHEMAPSDKTALQSVMEVDAERVRLEHEAEQLATISSDGTFHVSLSLYNIIDIIVVHLSDPRPRVSATPVDQ